MMKSHIQVEVKNVFGRPLIYPVCDTAKLWCAKIFNNQDTLTQRNIDGIKELGVEVHQVFVTPDSVTKVGEL